MSQFGSARARQMLAALLRAKAAVGFSPYPGPAGVGRLTFAFHDGEEIGPAMLSRIAKKTGLQPVNL